MPSGYNTMLYCLYKSAEDENKVCKQSLNKANNGPIVERWFCHKMFHAFMFIITFLILNALNT